MKYSSSNKPLVCMLTQSTCYKNTEKMTIKGVLWHSTGANNPTLRRYVQPSDNDKNRATLLKKIGKNQYGNDWNHIYYEAGVNAWIGEFYDESVGTVQTLPWNYRPWGCGGGWKGSCNDGWIQFEICEDGLSDKTYFNKVYKEACELTAYLCTLYKLNPQGTVTHNGVKVPVILCHQDSYQLGLGSNHGDVLHWFKKHGKTMSQVRKDVAALMNAGTSTTTKPTTTTTTVKTYKVVTKINKYATADDAKNKKSSKGTFTVGTYYIYNKYPSGYNGMYNITTDKTGKEPGGWINPAENKVPTTSTTETVEKLYRVRKTKDDAKTQKGAFKNLDGAKECCQSAGPGYNVFDWNWKIVYSYTAPKTETPKVEETKPQTPTTPEKVTEVYDLDYPEKNIIVSQVVYPVETAKKCCTQVIKKILSNNKDFNPEIAMTYFKVYSKYGIDPMTTISQAILETGWFKYEGSAVKVSQNNFCGLGVVSNGITGASFSSIEDGVRAQYQHLYAYGCKDNLPEGETLVDPRFKYVTRGIAPTWEQLAGRWAVPGYDKSTYKTPEDAMKAGNTYGQKIHKIRKEIEAVTVTESDIEKYFPKQETTKPETDVAKPEVDNNTTYIIGDANLDGKVNIKDATLIQKALVNLIGIDEIQRKLADADGDGRLTVKDATELKKWIAGLSKNERIGTEYKESNTTNPEPLDSIDIVEDLQETEQKPIGNLISKCLAQVGTFISKLFVKK